MQIWDEIQAAAIETVPFLTTVDAVMESLALGVSLMPITCAPSLAAKRLTFIKIAAVALQGAVLADMEIREAEDV